ncbi:MAG TPA: hypothetical protein VHA11_11990 [Bryobacteraceae bacterium]|nr:hypothetical protein [Bryobacteraceae bacterium]
MGLAFSPTAPDQVDRVRAFLAAAFGAAETAPFLNPAFVEWKWFAPRPGWNGPRSFVLAQGSALAAHGYAWPVTFLAPGGEVTSTRVCDWAGEPKSPGAGVLLFRKFGTLADTLLAVGGSAETQAILPRMGFARTGELALYARPVRPFAQLAARPVRDVRAAARLARNLWWSRHPAAIGSQGLEAVRVERFGPVPVPQPGPENTPARRDPELLNCMLACPAAVFAGYEIRAAGAVCGYFVLARVNGQARIADLWTTREWPAAYALALGTAARDPATCEVAAAASSALRRRAIEACGFHARGADPIYLFDPQRRLAGAPPLDVQLLDGDECCLNNPEYPFWS